MIVIARSAAVAFFGLVMALGTAHAAELPAQCAAAAQSWDAMRATATASQAAEFYQQAPKVCEELRGAAWSVSGERAGQPKPVAPQRQRDPCTPARVAWGGVRDASLAEVNAYRATVPTACEAQLFLADERIAALSGGAPPAVRGPGSVFRDCPACPEMVVIPAGTVSMGSPPIEKGRRANEGPQQTVEIASFAAGRFEVTFDQWDACVAGAGCGTKGVYDMRWGRGARPVVNVSFDDAQDYVAWLSRTTGKRYRLLMEPEWEYAARGRTTTAFWWGETGGTGFAHCLSCGSLFEPDRTAPVGSFPPNPFGLYDTSGNVWEWTDGCFAATPGATLPGDADPKKKCGHAIRGGSWMEGPFGIRSANRSWLYGWVRGAQIGFRVARDL